MGIVSLQVCPVCAMRVGVDMVAHITLQHGNIFKISFSIELLSITSSLQSFHALVSSQFFLVEFQVDLLEHSACVLKERLLWHLRE